MRRIGSKFLGLDTRYKRVQKAHLVKGTRGASNEASVKVGVDAVQGFPFWVPLPVGLWHSKGWHSQTSLTESLSQASVSHRAGADTTWNSTARRSKTGLRLTSLMGCVPSRAEASAEQRSQGGVSERGEGTRLAGCLHVHVREQEGSL